MVMNSTYFASWLVFFLFLGAIWYVVDRRIGVTLYRWYYNLTRDKPLPADQEIGFIYNRHAKSRFSAAVVLCLCQSALVISTTAVNPLVELLSFFFEVPVLMGGFYFGPYVYRLWQKTDTVLDTVDRIETGELKLENEIKDATRHAAESVRAALGIEEGKQQELVLPEAKEKEAVPAEPNPEEALSRYVGKDN